MSTAAPTTVDRHLALLLGLHGLAFTTMFPLGPQAARVWQPGVAGFAALTCAFPLAASASGLLARHVPRLPGSPRSLALLGALGMLAALLARGLGSLLAARLLAGVVAGLSFVALHRLLSSGAGALATRWGPRVVAFGLPLCLLGATALDWRAAFLPPFLGFLALAWFAGEAAPPPLRIDYTEVAPAGLVASGALAFVSGAYMTVLTGFLVFNSGHTEWHIPVALLLGALFGLAVPPGLGWLKSRFAPEPLFRGTMLASALVLVGLLALRSALPSPLALTLIGAFLATNAARHLALGGVVNPRLASDALPAHQTHTHIAHHLGAGLGAVCVALVVHIVPGGDAGLHFVGMPALLLCGLGASAVATLCPRFLAVTPPRRAQVGSAVHARPAEALPEVDESPAAFAAAVNKR